MSVQTDLEVLPTAAALADAAAGRFVAAAREAIRSHGQFVVALSGGTTPRRTYERLAAEPLASQVMWPRVQVLWGDERCVPPDQAESNYRMAREALLDHVPIPAANLHRIHGEDEPAHAAALYEAVLRALFMTPAGPPRAAPGARIDLILLGLGEDGHTASLFPGSAAARERSRWVVASLAPAAPMRRITLTPMVINAAADVLFLVAGGDKAGVVRQVREGPRRPLELPAQVIAPSPGGVHWLLDAAAAAELGRGSP